MKTCPPLLTLTDVQAARDLLARHVRNTPCLRMRPQECLNGIEVWLKRDDMQRTHSFKERGALHALLRLNEEQRARGVIAASAGNHALGLAYHGPKRGISVKVVMPRTASPVKIHRCRSLGAEVVLLGETYDGRAVGRRTSDGCQHRAQAS